MGYVRKEQPAGKVLSAEHARRRNADLRRELSDLTVEHAVLAPKVEEMRKAVSAARKKLTRQVRDLDAIRSQTANMAAMAVLAKSAEPVYGGPEGLQAAADEIKAHEDKNLKLSKRRPGKGVSHGTRSKYDQGCDCDLCLGWRKRKSERERDRQGAARVAARRAA